MEDGMFLCWWDSPAEGEVMVQLRTQNCYDQIKKRKESIAYVEILS